MTRLVTLVLVLVGAAALGVGQSAREYELKSAFLFSFAKFVEWAPLHGSSSPLLLCVLGEDPFGQTLDRTMEGKGVNGRPIVIKRASKPSDLGDCEIVFFPASEESRFTPYLKTLGEKPVLTVGETKEFTRSGGIVALLLDREKIVLEINVDAAMSAKIKISSRVLELARIVHQAPMPSRRER